MSSTTNSNAAAIPVRKREIFGWAMFDFANSSYTTLIVTVGFSIYFTKLLVPGPKADWYWGLGIFISNALVVLSAPVVGALADDSGRKKAFLFVTYLTCILGTAALYLVSPGQAMLGIALFIFSNVAFATGENLTGAFLPEISTPQNIGRISGFGWGLGYLGGLGCLLLTWPLIKGGFTVDNFDRLRWAWPATAAFFLVAAVPTFLLLKERAPRGPKRSPAAYIHVGFQRLTATARALRHFRELARFLAIFFVFCCGLNTVIAFASIFAERVIGFSASEIILLFMVLQVSSAAGAFIFGWIQDRIGARTTIQITLLLWIALSVATYFCTTKGLFWAIGVTAGLGIGSLQAASRALVGLFSPVTKSGEFFGFWGMANKGAYAVGPAIYGLVSSATGSPRLAFLLNGLFFIAGLIGMQFINEGRGQRAAEEWSSDPATPGLELP